jgi:hypothetical protein
MGIEHASELVHTASASGLATRLRVAQPLDVDVFDSSFTKANGQFVLGKAFSAGNRKFPNIEENRNLRHL